MKVQASLNNLRIAPRKVRLVTHSIIGVDAHEAVIQLEKQAKRSAAPIRTLLNSALANASNNFGLDAANLYVFEVRVGEGVRLKRWLPRAFGRATPLLKRSSKITIILEEKIEGKNRTQKKLAPSVVTVTESSDVAISEETEVTTGIKPEIKKTILKEAPRKTPGKVMKKVFQRKSV